MKVYVFSSGKRDISPLEPRVGLCPPYAGLDKGKIKEIGRPKVDPWPCLPAAPLIELEVANQRRSQGQPLPSGALKRLLILEYYRFFLFFFFVIWTISIYFFMM